MLTPKLLSERLRLKKAVKTVCLQKTTKHTQKECEIYVKASNFCVIQTDLIKATFVFYFSYKYK